MIYSQELNDRNGGLKNFITTSCTLSPKCNISTNSKQKCKQTLSMRSTDWKSSLKCKNEGWNI